MRNTFLLCPNNSCAFVAIRVYENGDPDGFSSASAFFLVIRAIREIRGLKTDQPTFSHFSAIAILICNDEDPKGW